MKHPRFVIDCSLIRITPEDVAATGDALEKMGLWKAPYNDFSIQVIDPECGLTITHNYSGSEWVEPTEHIDHKTKEKQIVTKAYLKSVGKLDDFFKLANAAINYLIVFLATKGIEKHTVKCPPNKKGEIKTPYSEVIYLRPDKRFSTHANSGHDYLRPHFRRGHIREQWYPSLGRHEKIWIEPCLVNADEDFIPEHKTYKVST